MFQNSHKSVHSPISFWIVSCGAGLPYPLIGEVRFYFAIYEFPTSIAMCLQDDIFTKDTTDFGKYAFYSLLGKILLQRMLH